MNTKYLKSVLLDYIEQKSKSSNVIGVETGVGYFIEFHVGSYEYFDLMEDKNHKIDVTRLSLFGGYTSNLYIVKIESIPIGIIYPYESHAYYLEEYRFNEKILYAVKILYTKDFLLFNSQILSCVLNTKYNIYKREYDCDQKIEYNMIKLMDFKRSKKDDTDYLKCYVRKSNEKTLLVKNFRIKISPSIILEKSEFNSEIRICLCENDIPKIKFLLLSQTVSIVYISEDVFNDEIKIMNMINIYNNEVIPLLKEKLLKITLKENGHINICNFYFDENFIHIFNQLNRKIKKYQQITSSINEVKIT